MITSGWNRVNEKLITKIIEELIVKGNADFVRQRTGFTIGGVLPVGHLEAIEIYLDEYLLAFDEIWAAAGTLHVVFRLTAGDLLEATGGKVISVVGLP